ncbi:dihydrodipicolinate synthase family protein [Paenibacillus sp. IB182363]|uniref:Dihydrodipicolinate synthase family protein n=2 Tax=Paenibacillus oceani TaxID=2772510 RepID=A0A927CDI9_9BACL|nr:dihydrodipicolinate synthase family protein [Paenibacillus oceani]
MNACYDEQGEVNPGAIRKLASHYTSLGVTGLYIAGSTGEGMVQSMEERKLVLQSVMEAVGGETTVIAHIGAASTRESAELAGHAERVGADAISAVPSIYYNIPESGVERHWRTIIESVSLPFIMYHIPQTTGFRVSLELLRRMAKLDKVIGIKVTTESAYQLQQFKMAGGDRFLVFNGPDEQYLAGRLMGADGGIGGTYGVMPELFLQIERCLSEGLIREAQSWQFKVNEIIAELLQLPLYAACKAILELQGFNCGRPRSPLEPLSEEGRRQAAAIYEKIVRFTAETKQAGRP